tara:strand:- start:43 stop:195 length:153 start_codon:yes stop_codon:yes gene_type:complete
VEQVEMQELVVAELVVDQQQQQMEQQILVVAVVEQQTFHQFQMEKMVALV